MFRECDWRNSLEAATDAIGDMDFAKAERLLLTALQVVEDSEGDPQDLERILAELAHVYSFQDKNDEAKATLDRLLELREQIYGASSLQVAFALQSLAELHQEMDEYGEAEPVLTRAMEITAEEYKRRILEMAELADSLSVGARHLGRLEEAKTRAEQAISLYEQGAGPTSFDLIRPMENYVLILSALGEDDKAKRVEGKLKRLKARFDERYPKTE